MSKAAKLHGLLDRGVDKKTAIRRAGFKHEESAYRALKQYQPDPQKQALENAITSLPAELAALWQDRPALHDQFRTLAQAEPDPAGALRSFLEDVRDWQPSPRYHEPKDSRDLPPGPPPAN